MHELDDYHRHEVLHTTNVVINLIDAELISHPYTLAHPAVAEALQEAIGALGRAYQATGLGWSASKTEPLTIDEARAIARRVLVSADDVSLLTGMRIVQETQLALRRKTEESNG